MASRVAGLLWEATPSDSALRAEPPSPFRGGIRKKRSHIMPRWLKRGLDASAIKAADAKVRETVENILAEIEARGDAAVRELSEKFDKWSPQNFRLSEQDIERAIAQVGKRDLEDIKFAQAQVRNFAQKQRDSMHDRSEEHTSELQSHVNLVCRLL